ncbi:ABC transporter substrate-binding protein [Halobacillus shinanisalinarum]|uniref:Thiamine pyrimidine synthase n=1 Tax=Halobacillus shinanisalinarum TaxID=2932258 RepID=A0ABY4GVE1_9BACI|nr:ABC transporter substrate-binding protein [Halobacillus shinanisalinarum]UOQ92140.1 ABC transporter substrate-binding protein [Halobacillus shinanisalinarum]
MEKLRFGLEWFLNPNHLPFLIGVEKGWFKEADLDVEMIEPVEHFDAMDEIYKGRMDMAVTEPLHLVQDRLKQKDVIGFSRFLKSDSGVMSLENKGITRPKDMLGKRLTYPSAPGPTGLSFVKALIEADGAHCNVSDVTPVNKGFYHTDALIHDEADIAFSVQQHHEVIEASERGYEPRFFSLKEWGLPAGGHLILITSREILDKRRQGIDKFLEVLKRSIEFIENKPEEAKVVYYQFTGNRKDHIEAAILDATLSYFTTDFSVPVAYFDDLQKWLNKTKLTDYSIDPQEYWTNEFVHNKGGNDNGN